MTPYSGLGFFFALALLPAAIAGLRGKNLRVCGFAVTAVMLLLIFDTPRKLLTLALFWTWQLALIFSYLHVRKKSEKRSRKEKRASFACSEKRSAPGIWEDRTSTRARFLKTTAGAATARETCAGWKTV